MYADVRCDPGATAEVPKSPDAHRGDTTTAGDTTPLSGRLMRRPHVDSLSCVGQSAKHKQSADRQQTHRRRPCLPRRSLLRRRWTPRSTSTLTDSGHFFLRRITAPSPSSNKIAEAGSGVAAVGSPRGGAVTTPAPKFARIMVKSMRSDSWQCTLDILLVGRKREGVTF